MRKQESKAFRKLIDSIEKQRSTAWLEIMKWIGREVGHASDVEFLCGRLEKSVPGTEPRQLLLGLLVQCVPADEASTAIVRSRAIPGIEYSTMKLLSGRIPSADAEEVMQSLKILVLYDSARATDLVVRAARRAIRPDDREWGALFNLLASGFSRPAIIMERLSDPLPEGFIAVAMLDAANGLCIAGQLERHPFDHVKGRQRLKRLLRDGDETHHSFAVSAAAAIPFVSRPARRTLMSLAIDHVDPRVQMEGALASAKFGSAGGTKMLARFATDIRFTQTALRHLKSLGQANVIPKRFRDPAFQAKAEMCQWLAHPLEFGRQPDAIELYDAREMFWPPTSDRRRVWLFRYMYRGEDGDEDNVGLGMVGSITFALFGDVTADLSPEDAYALHCCWELQQSGDSRAPEKRTVEAGRKILEGSP